MSATVITDNFFTLVPAVHHRFQLPYFHADFQAPAAEELLLRSQENLGQFSKAQVQRLAQWIGAFWAGGFGGFHAKYPKNGWKYEGFFRENPVKMDDLELYPLVKLQKTMEKKNMLSLGKSTTTQWPFFQVRKL